MASVTGPNMVELIRLLSKMGVVLPVDAPAKAHVEVRPQVVGAQSLLALKRKRATCPHCKRTLQVRKSFGVRNMGNGVIRVQSWCRDCRASPANPMASGKKGKR